MSEVRSKIIHESTNSCLATPLILSPHCLYKNNKICPIPLHRNCGVLLLQDGVTLWLMIEMMEGQVVRFES